MDIKPDIAYEIWGPDAQRKEWQIVVDQRVLGIYRTGLDAVEYATRVARETWEEAALRTVVIRCDPGGRRRRIAAFG